MLAPGIQVIEPEHLLFSDPFKPSTGASAPPIAADDLNHVYLPGKALRDLKVEIIEKTLARVGTQQAAADALKVSRDTIQRTSGKAGGEPAPG
jgi:transcriptional regulator with PAS, ATPase and Fis domain